MGKMKFRDWVRIIWLENVSEHEAYGELPLSDKDYWQRYKWWLKREYQFQQGLKKHVTANRKTNSKK